MIIPPPTIPPRTRPQLSEFVLDSIEAAGVHVPPSSRLWQIHKLYHSGEGIIGPNHPDFQVALEGQRDLQLLGFVFDQLSGCELSTTYIDLLQKLISDSVLPQYDSEHSPGRDAAFELYVAAICRSAQLFPVEFDEPDITFVCNGRKYGIAAKRIKNIRNLERRVREATAQIARSGLSGMIALDTCLALNPNNNRIVEMPDTIFWSEYFDNLKARWSRYQLKIQKIIGKVEVLGIVVHDYHVRQKAQDWQLSGMTMRVSAESRTIEEQRNFDTLSTLYTHALPNQEDVSRLPISLP